VKFSLSKITIVVISIAALTMVAIDTFFAGEISKSNTVFIQRTFKGIVEEVNRGQSSYNIYTYEDKDYYKIPADWPECFLDQNFKTNAHPGDRISIGIKTDNIITNDVVVSLKLRQVDYLLPTCINDQIESQKEHVAFLMGIFAIGGICYYMYKREHPKNEIKK
jgi:hypothetical protein